MIVIFDLDDCLWSPEMHELESKPYIPITGVLNDFANNNDDDDDDSNDETIPNVSMRQIMSHVQSGRNPPLLSSDKRSHFRLLHQESGIRYEEMLFFDDGNWGDHCTAVSRELE
jgi:Acid Phosphatase